MLTRDTDNSELYRNKYRLTGFKLVIIQMYAYRNLLHTMNIFYTINTTETYTEKNSNYKVNKYGRYFKIIY